MRVIPRRRRQQVAAATRRWKLGRPIRFVGEKERKEKIQGQEDMGSERSPSRRRDVLPGISTFWNEQEFPISKSTVARLATFVDAPCFDHVNPAADYLVTPRGHEVEETAAHHGRGRQEMVVGTILNRAVHRESIKYKCRT